MRYIGVVNETKNYIYYNLTIIYILAIFAFAKMNIRFADLTFTRYR